MRTFILTLFLLASSALASVTLEGSTDSLEIVTSAAGDIDYNVSWSNVTATALTTPGTSRGTITTATTTANVVSAPAASNWRYVKSLTLYNAHASIANTVTLQANRSSTLYLYFSTTLQPGEMLRFDGDQFYVYDRRGAVKTPETTYLDGTTITLNKIGATSEAAGLLQAQVKDTGYPGAWVPGTPGLNGDALTCSTSADAIIAGAPLLTDPAAGNYYLTQYTCVGTVATQCMLMDLIWYNTGLVVTTTTAQTITLPTLPSRDRNGSNNGDNWQAAILVTTATTNASAVTNTTLSYTDSDGNAGNTATIASFPATAVAGAFIPFQLAAGDRGIRNIASITLGTSYGAGAISLVLYRPLPAVAAPLANAGGSMGFVNGDGPKIWNGTCFWGLYLASATTANNTWHTFTLGVR